MYKKPNDKSTWNIMLQKYLFRNYLEKLTEILLTIKLLVLNAFNIK